MQAVKIVTIKLIVIITSNIWVVMLVWFFSSNEFTHPFLLFNYLFVLAGGEHRDLQREI